MCNPISYHYPCAAPPLLHPPTLLRVSSVTAATVPLFSVAVPADRNYLHYKRTNGRAAEQRSAVFSNKSEPRSDPRPSDPAYLSSPLQSPGLTAFLRPPYHAPALSMSGSLASATLQPSYSRPRTNWWAGTARQHTGRSAGIPSKRLVATPCCGIPEMLAAPWLPFTKLPPQTLMAAMFASGRANHRPLAACGLASSQPKLVLSTNRTRCNAMHPRANTTFFVTSLATLQCVGRAWATVGLHGCRSAFGRFCLFAIPSHDPPDTRCHVSLARADLTYLHSSITVDTRMASTPPRTLSSRPPQHKK